jgi:murein DD-endopeptidase MepM/ murein hydrolase activator NlpD
VQPGDVLSAIAAKYNIPVDEIMRANGLSDTLLRVGQQLVIPAATVTPTPTPTALPTSTPTQGLAFGAPMLLFPPDGASYASSDSIVMNWTAVGALAEDQFYVLRLRTLDGRRTESIWLKTPSYRLPPTWHDTTIVWDVIVLQVTQVNPDGTREGTIQSAFSEARQFTWQ